MNDIPWRRCRKIVERIVIEGSLVLQTPAHLGNGDVSGVLDMPLSLDPLEGQALLTGASLAGALRSYLRERESGYDPAWSGSLEETLFGVAKDENEGDESFLLTSDSLLAHPAIELRDGVAIDPKTRTAEAEFKYDLELLAVGSRFDLRLELLVPQGREEEIKRAAAIALQGLERNEIGLGARKRRGLGRCQVNGWRVLCYNLANPVDLLAWMRQQPPTQKAAEGASIASLLGVTEALPDERRIVSLTVTCDIDGSLLIRSAPSEANQPDFVHLRSRPEKENEDPVPILSGTSLTGALRARALRIVRALGADEECAWKLVEQVFGARKREGKPFEPSGSHLTARETRITNPLEMVHTRVKIDRFTGGSYPGALFSEQPVYGRLGQLTQVMIDLQLRQAGDLGKRLAQAQAGLLLLLLKDLWTGDLPLGGESSVGRGRLKGRKATFIRDRETWTFEQTPDGLSLSGDRDILQGLIEALGKEAADDR